MSGAAEGKKRRLVGQTLVKGIVVGSVAWPIARPADERTHQWVAYVRGAHHEDLSPLLRRVEFALHPTFAPPRRAVDAPGPFALREAGWGEFSLGVTLFFACDLEKPVQLSHVLRLHPRAGDPPGRPVVHEHYEEIVFRDPPEELAARVAQRPRKEAAPPQDVAELMAPVLDAPPEALSDAADLRALAKAQDAVDASLRTLEARCAELQAAEHALRLQLGSVS